MGAKEIIIDFSLAKKLKLGEVDKKTLNIEAKLQDLDIDMGGRIQGARPIKSRANGELPPNSAFIKIEGVPLIIAPEGSDAIYIVDKVDG